MILQLKKYFEIFSWRGEKKVIRWNKTFFSCLHLFITRNKAHEKPSNVVVIKVREFQELLKKWDIFQLCSLAAVCVQTDVTFCSCEIWRNKLLPYSCFLESCVYLRFHSYLNVSWNMYTYMLTMNRKKSHYTRKDRTMCQCLVEMNILLTKWCW